MLQHYKLKACKVPFLYVFVQGYPDGEMKHVAILQKQTQILLISAVVVD